MICFKCQRSFLTISFLIAHLKRVHYLNESNNTYRCVENKCFQNFQNLSSYKRHLIRKHSTSSHNELNQLATNIDVSSSSVHKQGTSYENQTSLNGDINCLGESQHS